MAVLLIVPVLLFAQGGVVETNMEAWYPEQVWKCVVVHRKQALHFKCLTLDHRLIKFSVSGVNEA